jgi:hypothetical protein
LVPFLLPGEKPRGQTTAHRVELKLVRPFRPYASFDSPGATLGAYFFAWDLLVIFVTHAILGPSFRWDDGARLQSFVFAKSIAAEAAPTGRGVRRSGFSRDWALPETR